MVEDHGTPGGSYSQTGRPSCLYPCHLQGSPSARLLSFPVPTTYHTTRYTPAAPSGDTNDTPPLPWYTWWLLQPDGQAKLFVTCACICHGLGMLGLLYQGPKTTCYVSSSCFPRNFNWNTQSIKISYIYVIR